MAKSKFLVVLSALALALAGCGGGGDSKFSDPGTSGGNGGATAASMSVTTSAAAIPADSSGSAAITALARDANNNAVAGVVVTFSSSAGSLAVTQATTDLQGVAKATLTAAGATSGTDITVTAAGGGASGNTHVMVSNNQRTVDVVTDSTQIPSAGNAPANITVTVRDANNQVVSGVTVSFQATSGAITVTRAVTDANGTAAATLNTGNDPTNRRITVTAGVGSSTATVPVDVVGTTLTITGSSSLVLNSQGTYNVSLTNSANAGLGNRVITIASAAGNTLSPAGTVTTDGTGQATFTVTATHGGSDTLSASALGLSSGQPVSVSNDSFAITSPAPNAKVALNTVQALTLTWTTSGVPQVGKTISFATTRGLFTGNVSATTAVTDAAGQATVSVSSAASGPATVTVSSNGVSTQFPMSFIATQPNAIEAQASPATIPVKGQSTVTAIVRDPQNNLVEGKTVLFQLTDVTGGALSVASAQTDGQGRAQTTYTASPTPSGTNGVRVTASVQGTALSADALLTVGGQTVFLSLGTGNKIMQNDPIDTQFMVPYTVTAVDAAGNPVNGVNITMSIHSVYYRKGTYIVDSGVWVQSLPTGSPPPIPVTTCPNEDNNPTNGVLDAGEDAGAFGNGNHILDPGDIAIVSPGSLTTANGGKADMQVIYPQDHALWVQSTLTATATVQGTETSTSTTFWLPMLAEYLTTTTSSPPGFVSPYGVAGVCTNPN